MDGFGPHNQFDNNDLPLRPQSGDWSGVPAELPEVEIHGEGAELPSLTGADIPAVDPNVFDALGDTDTSALGSGWETDTDGLEPFNLPLPDQDSTDNPFEPAPWDSYDTDGAAEVTKPPFDPGEDLSYREPTCDEPPDQDDPLGGGPIPDLSGMSLGDVLGMPHPSEEDKTTGDVPDEIERPSWKDYLNGDASEPPSTLGSPDSGDWDIVAEPDDADATGSDWQTPLDDVDLLPGDGPTDDQMPPDPFKQDGETSLFDLLSVVEEIFDTPAQTNGQQLDEVLADGNETDSPGPQAALGDRALEDVVPPVTNGEPGSVIPTDSAPVTPTEHTDAPAVTDAAGTIDLPLAERPASSEEVVTIYDKLQDRLGRTTYDDVHYAEIDTPSGSVIVSDRHRTDHIALPTDFVEAELNDIGFNEARWSERLLETHHSIVSISVQDGQLDDLEANETGHYIIARPCDLDPNDDSLGAFMADALDEQAPGVTMESTDPVMLSLGVNEPTQIVTDISRDPILAELAEVLAIPHDPDENY